MHACMTLALLLLLLLQRGPRRLLSAPVMPTPPGAARLVGAGSSTASEPQEAEMVQRVLRQIGSLKISSAAAALERHREETL